MAYVPVPKDLTCVKSKLIFNLTKRQVFCFGLGTLFGIPVFFLVKPMVGNSTAAIQSLVTTAWEGIQTTVSTVAEGIHTTISTAWENVKEKIGSIMESVSSTLSSKWEAIKTNISCVNILQPPPDVHL